MFQSKSGRSVWLVLGSLVAATAFAIVPPEETGKRTLLYQHPDSLVSQRFLAADQLSSTAISGDRLSALNANPALTQVDLRTGRFATLLQARPLIPGKGVGNQPSWDGLVASGTPTNAEIRAAVGSAYERFLAENAQALGIDPLEAPSHRITVQRPDHIIIHSPRVVAGHPVLDSSLNALIRHGNLVLWGAQNWGEVDGDAFASLSEADALQSLRGYAGDPAVQQTWKGSSLAWLPMSAGDEFGADSVGGGLSYRLVWVIRTTLGEPTGRFEARVDAATGEVLALLDTAHWVATPRAVKGGVLPASNDGQSEDGAPDGIEQPNWPMSFTNVTVGAETYTTDIGGNLPVCVDGNITASLAGPFMKMNDICGVSSLTGAGDLNFGASAGTDCTTPGLGGAGNTHASRSGFFEIGNIKEMAKSHLPDNTWLPTQLTATMNINQVCNANWDGSGVNFYRSGGGCFNTGELAGVFDHEWGHGMDNNDAVPSVSNPGEGIADVYATLRLHDSCIGRHFRATACPGYGDPCVATAGDLLCTGVRDNDWDNRASHAPHTLAWIDANCGGGPAPCGGGVHCEGSVYAESVWDLWNRGLPGGRDRAREIATQLTYDGAAGVTSWYTCTNGTGGCGNPNGCGCGATNGYMQYIGADDDNGNLADGTPNMQDIFTAFNAHQIACTVPTVQESGCAAGPTTAPTVTPTARDKGVDLSWTTVPNASSYRVYRTDGVFGCDFGKILVGETAGTTFSDSGLQNGRQYSYVVYPIGSGPECFGSAVSSCAQATPGGGVGNLTVLANAASGSVFTGDDDPFLDNCEVFRARVPLTNTSAGTLTGLEVTSAIVTSSGHGGSTFVTSFPKAISASFAPCSEGAATVDVIPSGLDPGETFTVEMTIDANELPSPMVAEVSYTVVEGDLQFVASRTYDFVADANGFVTQQGTFTRTATCGGGEPNAFCMQSSAFLDGQCDVVQSPTVSLTPTSTMTLSTWHDIEVFSGGQWWDRANIGLRKLVSGTRTLLSPDGGRVYNASGVGSACGTDNQGGWAGTAMSWAASSWTTTAMQATSLAGAPGVLEIRYATDGAEVGGGFRFDQVILTNFDEEILDAQGDSCGPTDYIFADDFEAGNSADWSTTVP